MKDIIVLESVKDEESFKEAAYTFAGYDELGREMQLIQLYPAITYQELKGFGGAFTPAAARVYAGMDDSCKRQTMELLMGQQGLAYTCGRITVGACDFSEGNYSYCEKEDEELKDFSIAHDRDEILPMLKDALKGCKDMEFLASPWSPPAWMKTNGEMCHGGSLKKEYRKAMADYIVKYLKAYAQAGINIGYITIQNEPAAVQSWESCIYTAEEEKVFIRDFMAPALKKAGLDDVKVIIWDHNKENVFQRAREICDCKEMEGNVGGAAFHWYSGDHFENLALCRQFFPDMELIFTEGCVEISGAGTVMAQKANAEGVTSDAGKSPWTFGECYGHDILGNMNHGMGRFMDWNVLLNEQGGPNHVGNYCSAPLIYDRNKKKLKLQPSFTFISHFSRFMKKGSKRIAFSRYTDKLQVTAWMDSDHRVTAVILNETDESLPFALKDMESGEVLESESRAHSIMTIVYNN